MGGVSVKLCIAQNGLPLTVPRVTFFASFNIILRLIIVLLNGRLYRKRRLFLLLDCLTVNAVRQLLPPTHTC